MGIKAILESHTDITFDRRFLQKVLHYVERFKRKDDNTIQFLGGNLIGVYPFKWLEEERLIWIHDVLNIDDIELIKDEIHSLEVIVPTRNVSSNVVSHTFIWVAHMFMHSKHLSEKERARGCHAALTMLQYGFLSSIHTRHFKYPANEAISMAVYEGLSRKFGLKKYGTWGALIDSRSTNIMAKDSIHIKYLRTMEDDAEMVLLLNDVQGRIKAVIKKLYAEYIRVRDTEARIAATGRFATMDGKQVLKESVNRYERVRERIKDVIPDTHSFIRQDAVDVIVKVLNTVSERQLVDSLLYLSRNFKGNKEYNILVEDMVIYTFEMIRKRNIKLDDTAGVILKLKDMYRSSRVTDEQHISIRERTGKLLEKALPKSNQSVIASARIGVILYIVLRALLEK